MGLEGDARGGYRTLRPESFLQSCKPVSLQRIIKPFPAMSHHKRAASPQTSLPAILSLFCFERSALASCTPPGTRALAEIALAGHR